MLRLTASNHERRPIVKGMGGGVLKGTLSGIDPLRLSTIFVEVGRQLFIGDVKIEIIVGWKFHIIKWPVRIETFHCEWVK